METIQGVGLPPPTPTPAESIPHICYFFYTGRIFENQILHQKKTTKGTENTENVSEKVKYMHFFTQSGKIYT